MSLKYDFDLVPVFGDDVFSGQDRAAALNSAGIARNALSNYVASFRDPATAEALRGADDTVKTMFRNAGFGFLPSGVTLPDFQYSPDHVVLREALLNRFADARENPALRDANWNGFNYSAFLACTLTARPAPQGAPGRKARKVQSGDRGPGRPTASGGFGHAIRFVIFFVAAVVILWQLTSGTGGGLLDGILEALSFQPQPL